MTDQSGAVTFAQTYDPYGVITATAGTSHTAYGFTNEYQSQGLVYLRARWYNPQDGRFQSRDTWGGDENQSITYNRWVYANANPIIYTDPSGNYGKKPPRLNELETIYRRSPAEALRWVQDRFSITLPPRYEFRFIWGGTSKNEDIYGVSFWMTNFIVDYFGTVKVYVNKDCPSVTLNPSAFVDGPKMEYDVFISSNAFHHYYFKPDDIAAIMIHEGTHAWQEYTAFAHVRHPGAANDPSSFVWMERYYNGMERQALYAMRKANANGRIDISQMLVYEINLWLKTYSSGEYFPFSLFGEA